jgi:hypothetical protein
MFIVGSRASGTTLECRLQQKKSDRLPVIMPTSIEGG